MNQRTGKMHAAGSDGGFHKVDMRDVIKMIRSCQEALEKDSQEDSAVLFEILGDYIEKDVISGGKSLAFNNKMLGL